MAERWVEIGGILAPGDRRPVVVTITLGKTLHLNHEGILTFTLFLDRLQNTKFYPSEEKAYRPLLEAAGIKIPKGRPFFLPPFTDVSEGKGASGLYKGRPFVCWSDQRLDAELRDWLKRNP